MTSSNILHMVVGRWRTPLHSNKEKDDSHKIKEEILNEVGKGNFKKSIGHNPDIGVEDGLIILKGRGKFKTAHPFRTNIPAGDYFILYFASIPGSDEIEIILLQPYTEIGPNETAEASIENVDGCFVIPNKRIIVEQLIDFLIDEYLTEEGNIKKIILIKLTNRF